MERVCFLSLCTIALKQQRFVLVPEPGLSETDNEAATGLVGGSLRWVQSSV